MTNQLRVFKACLTQTERVSDDVTRKIGPLDFKSNKHANKQNKAKPERVSDDVTRKIGPLDITISSKKNWEILQKICGLLRI